MVREEQYLKVSKGDQIVSDTNITAASMLRACCRTLPFVEFVVHDNQT